MNAVTDLAYIRQMPSSNFAGRQTILAEGFHGHTQFLQDDSARYLAIKLYRGQFTVEIANIKH